MACGVDLPRPKLIRIDELNAWILTKPRWEYSPIIWERGDEPGAIYAGCKPEPLAGSVTLMMPFENLWLEYRISGWSDVGTMLEMAKGLASPGL